MSANQDEEANQPAQGQQVGPSVISSPNAETRTLSHRGDEVDSGNVTRSQNTTGSLTEVLRWTVPSKYEQLTLAGGRHWSKFILRGLETFSGDGVATAFTLTADIQAIGGETTVADQPHPVVVAYDTAGAAQLTVDSVDYVADEVTFTTAPATGTDNVKVWYVVSEGTCQYRAVDAFSHEVGPLNEWEVPLHVFADFNQDKNTTQVHIPGAGRFDKDEELKLMVDSPRQVVWTDADFPSAEGQYVSTVEQRADVLV